MTLTSKEAKSLLQTLQNSTLPKENAEEFQNLTHKLEKIISNREKVEYRQVDKATRDSFKCWIFTEHFDPVANLDLFLMWPEFDPNSPHRLISSTKALTHCILERKSDGEFFYGYSLCDARDEYNAHKGEQRALGMAKKAVHHDASVTAYMKLGATSDSPAESIFDKKTASDKNAFFHRWIKLTRVDRNKMITVNY